MISGVAWQDGCFHRLPKEVAEEVSDANNIGIDADGEIYENAISGVGYSFDIIAPGYDRIAKASCVVIDGKNGADVLTDRVSDTWRLKGSVVRPSARDVVAAASTLCDALAEKTVTWYTAQQPLRESAVTSVKRPIGGGWGFGGEDSCPVEACALALWGAKTSKRDPSRRMRIG